MITIIVRCASAFSPMVRLLGGDPAQFRAILETKLTLDSRRPMIGFANRREREAGNAFTGAMVMYALIGVFLANTLWNAGSLFVGATLVHATILLMLTMTLIGDFTNVLLD